VKKYGTATQATDDNAIWCVPFACRIMTAGIETHIHRSQYLLLFHGHGGNANASRCYVIRTSPVLLYFQICVVSLIVLTNQCRQSDVLSSTSFLYSWNHQGTHFKAEAKAKTDRNRKFMRQIFTYVELGCF
jgi:hypothetical protein